MNRLDNLTKIGREIKSLEDSLNVKYKGLTQRVAEVNYNSGAGECLIQFKDSFVSKEGAEEVIAWLKYLIED